MSLKWKLRLWKWGDDFGLFLTLIIILAGFVGYIMNIYKLFASDSALEVIKRCAGLALPPIGAVLGYL